ncbi:MAG: amidohydrolase family protein [Sedimentisphaerales bacterium]|nr:amidohydrolase family protein [Sedimentisphaerales bacterium]
MKAKENLSRRSTLKGIGAIGAAAFLAKPTYGRLFAGLSGKELDNQSDIRKTIFAKVFSTPLIDTHEHLIEEHDRLKGKHRRIQSDDWTLLLSHYLNSDLLTSGMPGDEYNKFFSRDIAPMDKWNILAPYWPAVRNTGYGMAVETAIQQLYDVPELSQDTIGKVVAGYEKVRRKGFYKEILCEKSGIESCQVNALGEPFRKSELPTLLMQDISIVGMFAGPNINAYAKPAGIDVKALTDWYRVIDWWFETYGPYAVAVKSQNAYSRDIDYEKVPTEIAEPVFQKRLSGEKLNSQERKQLEDHLFWYAVKAATKANLPVKLHTGYYAGQNSMPLSRLIRNAGSATDLCKTAPKARFVFMHICYPYYEEILSVAKQYTNAYIDMCWSWIINPIAAKDFLKKYLVTAPTNKIVTFGGDYIPVEPVLGHAVIARRGIALALSELVEEGWLSLDRAIELTDPIMHDNARTIFNLAEKTQKLEKVHWST